MFPLKWEFYVYADKAWGAMLQELRLAKTSIDIEHYIFAADTIGMQFIEVLKEKIKEGVRVRLLIDGAGSYNFYNSNVPDEMIHLGIEVRFFHVISPWRIKNISSWFLRNHKKNITIDKRVSFIGGLGIRDNMTDWRDFTGKVEGKIVEEICDSFEDMWVESINRNFIERLRNAKIKLSKKDFITNDPYFHKRFLYYTFIETMRSAEKSICISTPYLIPDRKIMRILRLAVKRGVQVKIIVPKTSDAPVVHLAMHSTFSELLKSGVRIFEYSKEFIHAKKIIIDDDWATFGSFNMDNLSFRYNHEANVVTFNKKCIADIMKYFSEEEFLSHEINYSDWNDRPFPEKVKEFFIGSIRGFL